MRGGSAPDPLAEPRRVAMVGDWHMNGPWAQHAIHYAKDHGADVILHLGDFGYTFNAEFMKRVEDSCRDAGLPLLFVDGNHEDHPTLLRYGVKPNGLRKLTEHIWHLPRGFRWTWAGIRFLALGGAYSVDRRWRVQGVSWWKEETVTPEQAVEASAQQVDVLLSHDCPAGVIIPGIDDSDSLPPFPPLEIMRAGEHRALLREVVDQARPAAIWHGHYHRRYQARADFGYGAVWVNGMDCDGGQISDNVRIEWLGDIGGTILG